MFKELNLLNLILLNQYVQGIVTRQEVDKWFLSLEENKKQFSVKELWILATQAQVIEGDIPKAMELAGLRPSNIPVIMVSKGEVSFHKRGYKLSKLKGTVLNQAFWFVLECFALAERRRKEKEGTRECNHWWHKDLSDERVIKEILENN
jgi:hypothetical protein